MKWPDFNSCPKPLPLAVGGVSLFGMLSSSQIERKQWLEAKAAGKARFVRRGVVGSFANGLVVLLGLALFDPSHSFRESIVPALVVLPIFLVGGYLTAVWQWQDFEKKYSEDRLPPWK